MTLESYASQDCLVLLNSATFTLDACVATAPTSSSQSLGYAQWSYVKPIPTPKLTGYYTALKWADEKSCLASPIKVLTYKLNSCNIQPDGRAFTYSIISAQFSAIETKFEETYYSDSKCTSKVGDTSSGIISLQECSFRTSQIVLEKAFQLTTVTPTLVLRYSYR